MVAPIVSDGENILQLHKITIYYYILAVHRSQTGTTWGEKGKTPVVKGTGRRFGCNMIAAITNQGDLRFMVFDKRFTVKVFMEFLDRLVRHQAGRKVFLIVDRHAVHKAIKVTKWLGENEDKIRLFFPCLQPGTQSR